MNHYASLLIIFMADIIRVSAVGSRLGLMLLDCFRCPDRKSVSSTGTAYLSDMFLLVILAQDGIIPIKCSEDKSGLRFD